MRRAEVKDVTKGKRGAWVVVEIVFKERRPADSIAILDGWKTGRPQEVCVVAVGPPAVIRIAIYSCERAVIRVAADIFFTDQQRFAGAVRDLGDLHQPGDVRGKLSDLGSADGLFPVPRTTDNHTVVDGVVRNRSHAREGGFFSAEE